MKAKKDKLFFGASIWIETDSLANKLYAPLQCRLQCKLLSESTQSQLFQEINSQVYKVRNEDRWRRWKDADGEGSFEIACHLSQKVGLEAGSVTVSIARKSSDSAHGMIGRQRYEYVAQVSHCDYDELKAGISAFTVLGRKLEYRHYAFVNLYEALGKIGQVKEEILHGKSWRDYVNENLVNEFRALSDLDKQSKDGFVLKTGMVSRSDTLIDCDYSNGQDISLLFEKLNSGEWNIQIVVDEVGDPMPIEGCVPRIYKDINRLFLEKKLEALAKKADHEDWSYNGRPYAALLYYVKSVYEYLSQLSQKDKEFEAFEESEDDDGLKVKVFCTGLLTPDKDGAHYIYAKKWLLRSAEEDYEKAKIALEELTRV